MSILWKTLQIVAIVALAGLVFVDPAFADGPFADAQKKTADVFKNVRTIIFIVGGFGLVGLAFFAIFGKVNWKWFAALAVGLFILAVAGAIVDYATGKGTGGTQLNQFQ